MLEFYEEHGRCFAWRDTRDPYKILVSEVMLQQTQTTRVVQKFPEFIRAFPSVSSLARASQREVMSAWQGLGYYRRARNLYRAADAIVREHGGRLPKTFDELVCLPGIGEYTAAAVAVFAYEQPTPMIETNIRSVYLYAFFSGQRAVHDRDVLQLIADSIVEHRSRDWFYALMDIGVELKRLRPGINRASKHYARQSTFKGSDREVTAKVLKFVLSRSRSVSESDIHEKILAEQAQIQRAINRLERDSLVVRTRTGRIRPV